MNTNRLISSLCYFSIFFAGFIFPIAVYFIVDDKEVKQHAKGALVSHIVPFLSIPILFLLVVLSGDPSGIVLFLGFGIFGIINLIVLIWNVVKGVKVLRD